MTDLQPQESIVQPNDDEKMVHLAENTGGSDSPGGVDGLEPTATTDVVADECKLVESESASDVEGGDEGDDDDDDEDEEDEVEEINQDDAPEIDINEMNAEQLLALSKSRLDNLPQTRTTVDEEIINHDENEGEGEAAAVPASEGDEQSDDDIINSKVEVGSSPPDDIADEPVVKDQAYYIELAMQKAKESKTPSPQKKISSPQKNIEAPSSPQKKVIEDPAYLHKLAERKVAEAEAKAKVDEEKTGADNIIKPALLPAKPTRNENSELWALLNYSKARLETGATPTLGKKTGGSRGSSIRGADDTISISSKLSKSSKRSQSSRLTAPVTVVGGPGDDAKAGDEGPFPDVTDNGEAASVDGSVSLESATKNYSDAHDDDESDNSDDANDEDDDEDGSSEEEDEEEDLPDFLKDNDEDEIDPEEARELYEAAKFKAASILSVTKDNLTDVQMLQAIAIAEDAAKNGEDKFSTKRSLFKLNEAKVEDLKSLLSLSFTQTSTEQESVAPKARERYTGGWGIGGGRLMKKLGTVVQDFREKCEEIDAKKEQARVGQPTGKEILNAAMVDLRAQIEEYEKIVTKSGKR